jgi:hypothetical protein
MKTKPETSESLAVKTKIVSDLPKFLTSQEIKELDLYQSEIKRFDEEILSLRPTQADAEFEAAAKAYTLRPSDENFAALRQANLNAILIENFPPDKVQAIVESARDGFIRTVIIPFVEPLLQKALNAARSKLERVITDEASRYESSTGKKFPGESPMVAAAKEPITTIEHLLGLDAPSTQYRPHHQLRIRVTHAIEFLRAKQVEN